VCGGEGCQAVVCAPAADANRTQKIRNDVFILVIG
jgi:hypothetical protein